MACDNKDYKSCLDRSLCYWLELHPTWDPRHELGTAPGQVRATCVPLTHQIENVLGGSWELGLYSQITGPAREITEFCAAADVAGFGPSAGACSALGDKLATNYDSRIDCTGVGGGLRECIDAKEALQVVEDLRAAGLCDGNQFAVGRPIGNGTCYNDVGECNRDLSEHDPCSTMGGYIAKCNDETLVTQRPDAKDRGSMHMRGDYQNLCKLSQLTHHQVQSLARPASNKE